MDIICIVLISFVLLVILPFLNKHGHISKRFFLITLVILALFVILCVHQIIPVIKDFPLVKNNEYLEEDAMVVEFTYVRENLDGNGQIHYSKPKFYIQRKNEYVILNLSDVEIGKSYRIRYYPNTRIGEVLFCLE